MDHPTLGRMLLVVNPRAGDGRAVVLGRLLAALTELGLEADVAETVAAGDATRIARERGRGRDAVSSSLSGVTAPCTRS
jgi:diacylglycerol kinase family enzyme